MKIFIKKLFAFFLLKVFRLNPDSMLYFAYYLNNIRPGHDIKKNGELFFIKKVERFFHEKKEITIFDVGANEGNYSKLLSEYFPSRSKIYAFEPNAQLTKLSKYGKARVFPIGLGETKMKANLFLNSFGSQEATIHEGVAKLLHSSNQDSNVDVMDIEIDTLDNICKQEKVDRIDFLKIDTEGNEYAVLLGSKEMLQENKISIIQFEFNEMNVISRVFLKDFYELISSNFSFYRLHKNELFPLNHYKSHNEIFVWHNLIAVNKELEKAFSQA